MIRRFEVTRAGNYCFIKTFLYGFLVLLGKNKAHSFLLLYNVGTKAIRFILIVTTPKPEIFWLESY